MLLALSQLCTVFLYLVGLKSFGDFFLITLTSECTHQNKKTLFYDGTVVLRTSVFLHMALLSAENLHMALPLLGSG